MSKAPRLGSLFECKTKDGKGCWLLRIHGVCEDTGLPRYQAVYESGEHHDEFASTAGRNLDRPIEWEDAPAKLRPLFAELVEAPPPFGPRRRTSRFAAPVEGFPPLPPLRCPIERSPPWQDLARRCKKRPCKRLSDSPRVRDALKRIRLEADPNGSVDFAHVESRLRRYKGEEALEGPAPPHLRLVRGQRGVLPTIVATSSHHPLLMCPYRYASTPLLLSVFGYDADPLGEMLVKPPFDSPSLALRALGQGVGLHSVSALLKAVRTRIGDRVWRVGSGFSGADTFGAAVRVYCLHAGIECQTVLVSESDPRLRRLLESIHPHLSPVPSDSTSKEAVMEGADCDLFHLGFPCVRFTPLARGVKREDVDSALDQLKGSLSYLDHHSPSVVLLENVPSLAGAQLGWALDRVRGMLPAKYEWSAGLVCNAELGGCHSRLRLYILGLRRR